MKDLLYKVAHLTVFDIIHYFVKLSHYNFLENFFLLIKMDFLQLPIHLLAQQLKNTKYNDILNFCLTNKKANEVICNNDNFWQNLYNLKFPNEKVSKGQISWKQHIINKEFNDKVWLSKISWAVTLDKPLYIRNDDGKLNTVTRQINNYLTNEKIVWTTDLDGWVWIVVDVKLDGTKIYIRFRPEECPNGLEFSKYIQQYYQQDSGLTLDEFKDYYLRVHGVDETNLENYKRTFDNDDNYLIFKRHIEKAGYIPNKELHLVKYWNYKIVGVELESPNEPGIYTFIWIE